MKIISTMTTSNDNDNNKNTNNEYWGAPGRPVFRISGGSRIYGKIVLEADIPAKFEFFGYLSFGRTLSLTTRFCFREFDHGRIGNPLFHQKLTSYDLYKYPRGLSPIQYDPLHL